MPGDLEIVEGLQEQSSGEVVIWAVDTTNFTASPSNASVKAFRLDNKENVTTTLFPSGSPSVVAAVITLPALQSLKAGRTYRIQIKFDDGSGSTFEPFFNVKCPY